MVQPKRADHPLAVVTRALTKYFEFECRRVPNGKSCSTTAATGCVRVRIVTALRPLGGGEIVQVTVGMIVQSQTAQLSAGSWLRPAAAKEWTLRLDAVVEEAVARARQTFGPAAKTTVALKITVGGVAPYERCLKAENCATYSITTGIQNSNLFSFARVQPIVSRYMCATESGGVDSAPIGISAEV